MPLDLQNLQDLIKTYGAVFGYLVIWGIIFAESGLFFGFFLPGDTLLIVAGVLASPQIGVLNIWVLVFGCFVFAVLGDNVGYATGYRFGRKLFQKEDSWLFKKQHLITAENFYEKHGKKAIVLARFMPIVRTFAPIVAGIAAMHYRTFMAYNLIGGLLWAVGVTFLGYLLVGMIPPELLDKYLLGIIAVVIVLSFLPSVFHIIQERNSHKE